MTKKGGVLLVTVPFSEQIHEEPHDYFRFTHYGLQYLLEKSGWKISRIYTRSGIWLELGYRVSSFLYSSIGANQDRSGNLQSRFILDPIVVLICMIIQVIALTLDNTWKSNISTIGYGMLA